MRSGEDLGDHAEVAVRRQVREFDAVVLAAQEDLLSAPDRFGESVLVAGDGDTDVMEARSALRQELA